MSLLKDSAPSAQGGLQPTMAASWQEAFARSRALKFTVLATLGLLLLSLTEQLASPITDELTSTGTWSTALGWSVPIMMAGLGGVFAERAGVVNIGLEGMLILGTWFGAWGTLEFGPVWGLVVGAIGGALGGLLHAIATVSFGVDHIISGVAINVMAPGITRFLSDQIFTDYAGGSLTQSPRVTGAGDFTMPFLAGGRIPGIAPNGTPDILGALERWGSLNQRVDTVDGGLEDVVNWSWFFVSHGAGILRGFFFDLSWSTLAAYLLVPISVFVLWKTPFGLRLRSCGEHPVAADSLGVDVYRYKYYAVVISGALAGLGGAYLAVELTGIYKEGQTLGRGFIGLATVIFGNWKPVGMALGALLFGVADTLQLRDRSATHGVLLFLAMGLAAFAIWKFVSQSNKFGASHRSSLNGSQAGLNGWVRDNTQQLRTVGIYVVVALGVFLWYLFTENVPNQLPKVVPHFTVLIVLVIYAARLRPPAADGMRYRRGQQ